MLLCEITRKESMPTVPFQKITEACKTTGLSRYFLRQGCKNGTVPHIKSGGVYYHPADHVAPETAAQRALRGAKPPDSLVTLSH